MKKFWMVFNESREVLCVSEKSPTNAVKLAKRIFGDIYVSRPVLCSENLFNKEHSLGIVGDRWTIINGVAELNSDINTDENCMEMRSLLDGAIEIIAIWKPQSPSQEQWKKDWLEKAKKHGAEIE